MSYIIIRNAAMLLTMDQQRRELKHSSLLIEKGQIIAIETDNSERIKSIVKDNPVQVIDATDCLVTPGLINTHHHLYQTLTRVVPSGQDALLFDWLRALYPIWARYTPEDMYISTQLGLAELALSGCSLSSDHLYLYPNGSHLSDTIAAAEQIGIRFHPTRGSMSIGESKGGLPPDALVENEPAILKDCIDVIDRFHDPRPESMLRVGIAPCSPFSVSRELMRDAAELAREKKVRLHTHLAENEEDIAYSLANFGCRPGEYAQTLGWVGNDVWHAHCVKLDAQEMRLFAQTQTGIAHCPCSNCRLGSGIAPISAMREAGVPIGLGVDGSASNDSGDLVAEARQALLMQRVAFGASVIGAREVLELATLGGATVLGWADSVGSLEVGKRADIAIWDMNHLSTAGAWDPVAALIFCGPHRVRDLLVEGRWVVNDGQLLGVDTPRLQEHARKATARLMIM